MHTSWPLTGNGGFAFGHSNGVTDVVFAEAGSLARHFEIGNGGLGKWERGGDNFGNCLGRVSKEGEGC